MPVFRLTLKDEKPPSWNKFYAGVNWRVRQDEVKRVRALILAEYLERHEALPDFVYPVHAICCVYFAGRMLDTSNIVWKLYEDGLIETGILKDDSPKYVASSTVFCKPDKEAPRLEIALYDSSSHLTYINDLYHLITEETSERVAHRQPAALS